MKGRFALWVVTLILVTVSLAWAELQMGQAPETITLSEKQGGRLDGTPWSSEELKGKVSVLFYVDPDEKDLNNDASEALKAAAFSLDKYQSFAIINMAATWLPNFAISSSLQEKQKKYTNTIYVRDYKKHLVNSWGLTDNSSDVLVFDKDGGLIFRKDGKLDEKDIQTMIQTIEAAIAAIG